MEPSHSRIGWAFSTSLLTHVMLLVQAPTPRPREPALQPQAAEFALVRLPDGADNPAGDAAAIAAAAPAAPASAAPAPAEWNQNAPKTLPTRRSVVRAAKPAQTRGTAADSGAITRSASKSAAIGGRSERAPGELATGSGALERTLRRIAATSQLSLQQRREAMLVVLRTWEDPSRTEQATLWVDRLLREHAPEP
jgi:hypothetical protein